MNIEEIYERAAGLYHGKQCINAYIRGFCDGRDAKIEKEAPKASFFTDLAKGLRALWPPGEKDGKFPWRCSEEELVERLRFMWGEKNLGQDYTISDCLATARRYLAQYRDNATYMHTLKNFVVKQNKLVEKDGRIRYTYSSIFADMLQGGAVGEEDTTELEETLNVQGELI